MSCEKLLNGAQVFSLGRALVVFLCASCLFDTLFAREPVWPSGKALGWQAEGPQFESASALLSLQKLWSVDTVL